MYIDRIGRHLGLTLKEHLPSCLINPEEKRLRSYITKHLINSNCSITVCAFSIIGYQRESHLLQMAEAMTDFQSLLSRWFGFQTGITMGIEDTSMFAHIRTHALSTILNYQLSYMYADTLVHYRFTQWLLTDDQKPRNIDFCILWPCLLICSNHNKPTWLLLLVFFKLQYIIKWMQIGIPFCSLSTEYSNWAEWG